SAQLELAGRLGISPAQISNLVELLSRMGLIRGARPASDRRRQVWRLTPQGGETLTQSLESLHHRLQEAATFHEPNWPQVFQAFGGLLDQLELLDAGSAATALEPDAAARPLHSSIHTSHQSGAAA